MHFDKSAYDDGESSSKCKITCESCQNNESELVKLYVYQPYVRLKYIKLNVNCFISILNTIYPSDSAYLFNGEILDLQRTFKDYNISENNKIVLLPSNLLNTNPEYVQKWIKLTSDIENFEARVDFNISRGSNNELARIKDIRFLKLERKKKFIDRVLNSKTTMMPKSEKQKDDDENNKKEEQTNCDYVQLASPSDNALPVLWE